MNRKALSFFALSLALTATGALAQDATQSQNSLSPDQLKRSVVFNHIHHINQKEIQLSQLAAQKAENQKVKDYATHMIQDHQRADAKLVQSAKEEGISLSSFQPADFERLAMDQLKQLNGSDFDLAFVDMMKAGHHNALEVMQTAMVSTKDPQLRALIQKMTPDIREHAQMASRLGAQMTATG